ncbi:hypothetical protein HPB47_012137 [Ixodes persulcatus]|uniref:Uncharacterized protein n=1 Tax=Ixodes persulcatus TaxID=34615 RepID=A0AC60NUK5_IXOPE|nr:hypothetical protein HPB47_012137 [Ixodes persulcatus]
MEPSEIWIDVPFGRLAAKVWGSPSGKPVLALHGWLDSAATFDTLAPLLNPSLKIVALDLSGHGKSSHRPKGSQYNYLEYVVDVRRVVHHFQWDRFSILGHSMGASVGLLFSGLFPRRVESLVTLDVIIPMVTPDAHLPSVIAGGIVKFLKLEARMGSPPTYSQEELLERLEAANPGLLSERSKRLLLARGAEAVPGGGYQLRRDVRAKTSRTFGLPLSIQEEMMSGYTGDILIFKSTDNILTQGLKPLEQKFRELYKKCCGRFEFVELQGGHYVHLNRPELLAPTINRFLCAPSRAKL